MMERFSIYKRHKNSSKVSFIGDIFANTESDAQNAVTKTYGDDYYVKGIGLSRLTSQEFKAGIESSNVYPKDEKAKRN